MNATTANRVIRPVNGIGPGIGPSARQQAEKRARDLARERKLERVKQQAIGYAKGYAASRYAEAQLDIARMDQQATIARLRESAMRGELLRYRETEAHAH